MLAFMKRSCITLCVAALFVVGCSSNSQSASTGPDSSQDTELKNRPLTHGDYADRTPESDYRNR